MLSERIVHMLQRFAVQVEDMPRSLRGFVGRTIHDLIKVERIDDIIKCRLQLLLKLHDVVMLSAVSTTLEFINSKEELLIPDGISQRDDIRFVRLDNRLIADISIWIFGIDQCLKAPVKFRSQSLHPISVIDYVGIE